MKKTKYLVIAALLVCAMLFSSCSISIGGSSSDSRSSSDSS